MGDEFIYEIDMLIGEYCDKVYNMAFRMTGNKEDAMDITQEVFLKAFQKLKNFKGKSSIGTWVYRITYNTCIDQLRKRKYSAAVLTGNIRDEENISDIYEANERRRAVHKALYKLNTEQRAVIVMRDIQGFSYEEIATVLQCPLGTVKSKISRARFKLKEIIMSDKELFEMLNV